MSAGSESPGRISTDQDVLVSSWRDPHTDAKACPRCRLVVYQIRFAPASHCDNALPYLRTIGLAQWKVSLLTWNAHPRATQTALFQVCVGELGPRGDRERHESAYHGRRRARKQALHSELGIVTLRRGEGEVLLSCPLSYPGPGGVNMNYTQDEHIL